ncbi:hypothetical protein BaRGS_00037204, partial [Batillaria attramentaria]
MMVYYTAGGNDHWNIPSVSVQRSGAELQMSQSLAVQVGKEEILDDSWELPDHERLCRVEFTSSGMRLASEYKVWLG